MADMILAVDDKVCKSTDVEAFKGSIRNFYDDSDKTVCGKFQSIYSPISFTVRHPPHLAPLCVL